MAEHVKIGWIHKVWLDKTGHNYWIEIWDNALNHLYLYRTVCVSVCLCVSWFFPSVYPSPSVVRSGPNLAPTGKFHLEKVMGEIQIVTVWPRGTGGGGGLRTHKLTNVGKMLNRWTDRHQIVHTYADSFRNEEHRLTNKYPLETPGGILEGFMRSQIHVWELWLNSWTEHPVSSAWPQKTVPGIHTVNHIPVSWVILSACSHFNPIPVSRFARVSGLRV